MRLTAPLLVVVATSLLAACQQATPAPASTSSAPSSTRKTAGPDPSRDLAYVCPMDPDMRSDQPGTCPRCGMTLVAGIPEPREFHFDLTMSPKAPQPNEPVELRFEVFDPWKHNPVTKFSLVHEKLLHAFIVSRDLQVFVHDHPTWDGKSFHYTARFPKPGMYRIASDFYPEAATPQMLTQTVFVAGTEPPAAPLTRDDSAKDADNLKVAFTPTTGDPIAGTTAQLRFSLTPGDGLEKYLGAWGHMLAVSDDLIDMIHTHPFIADGRPEMQFNIVFPRARMYRIWVQFQRLGIVNTVHFDIPVASPGT